VFSIGEFSRISGVSVRTLRYYHDEGILIPAAVDAQSNYRLYDERNLEIARVIVALRRLEFPLEDIREVLSGCNEDADVLLFLERQRELLKTKLQHYTEVLHEIDQFLGHERQAREEEKMNATTFEVVERDVDGMLVGGIRMRGRYSDCGQGFAMLGRRLGRHIGGKPLCLYYDGEYREEDADFEPCMPLRKLMSVEGISVRELSSGHCASLMHRGAYEDLGRSYARALTYAKEHNYHVDLPTREIYHKGPGMFFKGNPKNYLTEIQLLVSKP
jgi:DNA-binding transcriptional MerR regulator/effector-binding domain-containing protein